MNGGNAALSFKRRQWDLKRSEFVQRNKGNGRAGALRFETGARRRGIEKPEQKFRGRGAARSQDSQVGGGNHRNGRTRKQNSPVARASSGHEQVAFPEQIFLEIRRWFNGGEIVFPIRVVVNVFHLDKETCAWRLKRRSLSKRITAPNFSHVSEAMLGHLELFGAGQDGGPPCGFRFSTRRPAPVRA